MMRPLTLARQKHPLADPAAQKQLLASERGPSFQAVVSAVAPWPMRTATLRVLQVNVGKKCNQTCRHCHVDAGPDRAEVMSQDTMRLCLDALDRADIPILDITGGAPEMHPHFRWFVGQARRPGRTIIDRCNLTILLAAQQEDLPAFLARHQVEVVASLPCYLPGNTDRQRGEGVFERSIEALRRLNDVGYGQPGAPLSLTLVFNPVGPTLPPPQQHLEAAYRRELRERHGIVFTRLFTLANMPISRFLSDLLEQGAYDDYMRLLTEAFNPAALDGLMCRDMLSVAWDGRLFDCDFNQMLDLPLAAGLPTHIRDLDAAPLAQRDIVTGRHCFGCTAGQGSGCQGALVAYG